VRVGLIGVSQDGICWYALAEHGFREFFFFGGGEGRRLVIEGLGITVKKCFLQ
jgi:hypothetical protein